MFVGGTGKPGARRAARFDLPFLPAANLPELAEYYNAQCAEKGVNAVHHDAAGPTPRCSTSRKTPTRRGPSYGKYFLHEATTYAGWQTPDIHSAVHSHATTAEELRAEGIYRVVTPDQCIEENLAKGDFSYGRAAPDGRRNAARDRLGVAAPVRREGAPAVRFLRLLPEARVSASA